MGSTLSRLKVQGREVSLHRAGAGAPLLYLHGNEGLDDYLPAVESLAARFQVTAPLHPGFGEEIPDWLDNIGDYALFYLDLIETLGLGAVHVVGHSVGAWIALEMAVRCPVALRTLTIGGAAGIHLKGVPKGDPFFWSAEKVIRHSFADEAQIKAQVAREKSLGPEALENRLKDQRTLARVAWAPPFFNPHLERWLHRASMPSHIVWGEQDGMFPLAYAHRFKELLPQAKLTILLGCGHLSPLERTADYAEAVAGFLGEAS